MKKRFKTFLGFFALVLAVSFVKSTFAATVLNGNYYYNEVGTSYKLLMNHKVDQSGCTIYANTKPTTTYDARLNITKNGTSVTTGDFPYRTARNPISTSMSKNATYSVYVKAKSGHVSGSAHCWITK